MANLNSNSTTSLKDKLNLEVTNFSGHRIRRDHRSNIGQEEAVETVKKQGKTEEKCPVNWRTRYW